MKLDKKRNLLAALLVALNLLPALGQNYRKVSTGIEVELPTMEIKLQFFNQSTVRVQKSVSGWKYIKNSLAVTTHPQKENYSLKEVGNDLQIATSSIVITINKANGEIT